MKVIVIGAGIVGLSTAYWLARDGHAVTVVDRAESVGQGASFANGGQLSYSYVAPLASPSVLRDLPRWLLGSGSPIKFRPAAELGQLSWVMSFLMACTDRRSRATTEILLSLAEFSRQALHELIERETIAFDHRRNGKIVFYSTRGEPRQRDSAAAPSRPSSAADKPCWAATNASISSRRSPPLPIGWSGRSIRRRRRSVIAGCCATSSDVCSRSAPYQVAFRLGTEVRELIGDRRRVRGARLAEETIEADLYMICAGSESRRLLRKFGVALPVYPIRGYSISAEILDPAAAAPDKSITDHENRDRLCLYWRHHCVPPPASPTSSRPRRRSTASGSWRSARPRRRCSPVSALWRSCIPGPAEGRARPTAPACADHRPHPLQQSHGQCRPGGAGLYPRNRKWSNDGRYRGGTARPARGRAAISALPALATGSPVEDRAAA